MKPTYQLHRYVGLPESLTGASNAVDGLRTNLSVWSGQCAISENRKQTATWWVNLTSILSIHHVTIYYRTGNVPWGMFLNLCFREIKENLENRSRKQSNTISFSYLCALLS